MSFSTFPPVYFASRSQGYGFGQRKRAEDAEKRRLAARKRDGQEDEDADVGENDDSDSDAERSTSLEHPVSLKDPYHIAGWSREKDLPAPPFPHRAAKAESTVAPLADELAVLNPPILNPPRTTGNELFSLKHRTYDNLTAIFHTCVLRNDWDRAYRAWTLLIRVPIAYESLILRQYDRWAMAAETLMRRSYISPQADQTMHDDNERETESDTEMQSDTSKTAGSRELNANIDKVSIEGLIAARNFYRRLIIQFPAKEVDKRGRTTAIDVNPSMYSIWLYAVQLKSKQELDALKSRSADLTSEKIMSTERTLREEELTEASEILKELQILIQTPPYDGMASLLRLRAMLQLWISDLYSMLAHITNDIDEQDQMSIDEDFVHHESAEVKEMVSKSQQYKDEAEKYLAELSIT